MLTWGFVLTLIFSELGGGGTVQAIVAAESEQLCRSLRRAIMTQLPDMNGFASTCKPLDPAQAIQPEKD